MSVIRHNKLANKLIPVPTKMDNISGYLGGTKTSLLNCLIKLTFIIR